MGLFGGSSGGGDTGSPSKLRTSSGSQDLDLSYGNDALGGHGFSENAGNPSSEDFAGALQMQGQMAQLMSQVMITIGHLTGGSWKKNPPTLEQRSR